MFAADLTVGPLTGDGEPDHILTLDAAGYRVQLTTRGQIHN